MNKLLVTLFAGIVCSATLFADFARVEMGAGAWQNTPKGFSSYTSSGITYYDVSTEKEETNPYVWLLIKHPIPVVPNLRLEYVDITTKGLANGTFKNFTAVNANTQLDLTQYDIIPYYNILDNTAWITLDLGLDIKLLDTSYQADGVTINGVTTSYNDTTMLPIPLVYTRVRFEIPGTNIGLEGDAKYISYSDSTIYDVRVKVDYTLDFIPVIQPAVEIGYRKQKYDIDEDDLDAKLNMEFSGVYAGMMLRF